MWTFFEIGRISYLSGNLSKILYGSSKMILLCSGKDFIYTSTSRGSDVIMTSNCIFDIMFFHLHCRKHKWHLDIKNKLQDVQGFKISRINKV